MIEISTLSGKANTKKVKYKRIKDVIQVQWGASKFKFTDELYYEILDNFLEEETWHPLGSCYDNPTEGGLGEFIESLDEFSFNPKYASAIAAIMHDEDLIEYRMIGNSIEISKRA